MDILLAFTIDIMLVYSVFLFNEINIIIIILKEVSFMANGCEVCGKGKKYGNKVSFSNKTSRRSWSPNLIRIKAIVNGSPKRINVCTRCLRSGYVQRAL